MNDPAFRKGYSLVVREGDDLERLLPASAAAGFEGIEPTFVTGAIPSPEEHTSGAQRLRGLCDRLGLAIPSMRAGRVPWTTIPSKDARARSAALHHMRMAFESLQIMGGARFSSSFPVTERRRLTTTPIGGAWLNSAVLRARLPRSST